MKPPTGSERLVLARVGAPHGVRGEVRLKPFTEDPERLAAFGPLETRDGRRFTIERLRPAGTMLIAKLKGVDERDQAEALNGAELMVDRARLPEPDDPEEFYHADLIGLEAVDTDGAPLGTVVAVHDFGAGDILDIAPSGRGRGQSLLVPFTSMSAPHVDLAGGRIVIDPPAEIDAPGEDEEEGR
jgi:16S rRNA processing protein RimM